MKQLTLLLFAFLWFTACKKNTATATGNTVTDVDGNIYNTVTIGTQVWMKENLKTTHYKNGNIIPQNTDATQWTRLTTGAWCNYNNDPINENIYGKLYNWFAVTDSNGLAPQGWHVPNDADWTILTNYLGGDTLAGSKMKEEGTSHWINPTILATNSSGFTALPGGYRTTGGGFQAVYSALGVYCMLWSSTLNSRSLGSCRYMTNFEAKLTSSGASYNSNGFSVRCVKN